MRKMVLGTIVSVAVALPGAALAQGSATRTADDYVCQLTQVCEEQVDAELPTKDAPATKGFSLTRKQPMAAAAPTKPAPDRKGFSISRRAPAQAPVVAARAERPKALASATRAKSLAKATSRGDLNLGFELGSAVLTSEARANAREFAKALMSPALAGKKVLIEGHTDRQGSREMNLDLSERRAQAVAEFLQTQGVPSDRLQVKGFGFDKPLPGRSAAASENRRVEAVLVS